MGLLFMELSGFSPAFAALPCCEPLSLDCIPHRRVLSFIATSFFPLSSFSTRKLTELVERFFPEKCVTISPGMLSKRVVDHFDDSLRLFNGVGFHRIHFFRRSICREKEGPTTSQLYSEKRFCLHFLF